MTKSASGGERAERRPGPQREGVPLASRLTLPAVYGSPRHGRGLLKWSHIQTRMANAAHYWVCANDGRSSHVTPVDGIWLDDRLYFGGDPGTKRQRLLRAHPQACVHLESAEDVVILYGEALEVSGVAPDIAARLEQASKAKYGYAPPAAHYESNPISVFVPKHGLAWTDLRKDPTRFRF